MELLYLDYNCFQRGFDDPGQLRIQMESLACQEIFLRAQRNRVRLIWSFMHDDETHICPFPARKIEVLRLSFLCKVRIGPLREIRTLAEEFHLRGKISPKNAVHLACASYRKADFFVTCDDRLFGKEKNLGISMKIVNPIDYLRGE